MVLQIINPSLNTFYWFNAMLKCDAYYLYHFSYVISSKFEKKNTFTANEQKRILKLFYNKFSSIFWPDIKYEEQYKIKIKESSVQKIANNVKT